MIDEFYMRIYEYLQLKKNGFIVGAQQRRVSLHEGNGVYPPLLLMASSTYWATHTPTKATNDVALKLRKHRRALVDVS